MESQGFACELNGIDLQKRSADWKTLAGTVRTKQRIDNGFRIIYGIGAAEALRSLVDAERSCCSWATWACQSTDEGEVLEVTGPAEQVDSLAKTFGV